MDIVILSNFCMDFSKTDNGRFSYLANMLSKENSVEIITSDFLHITKQHRKEIPSVSYKVTLVHEPGYKRNISFKRFISHYIWGHNVANYLKQRKKPDVIFCAVPSLTGPYLVGRYCHKNSIRFVIDIQDLWPEAFQMIVNIPLISWIGFAPFRFLANGIYRNADSICAVSNTYTERALMVNKKCYEGTTVFLGTDLSDFDKYASKRITMNKKENEVLIAYCGTLGSSYDLTCVIDALALLNDNRIRFIVMGDGPLMKEFEKRAKEKEVCVEFVGRLQYDDMCSFLAACDIAVNPITHKAAQSIINKHADYTASGLPIISTQENKEFKDLIEKYKMGFNCRNNDAEDLANKIKMLVDNEILRKELGANARRCAEEKFDRKKTYQLLINQIVS